GYRLRKAFWGRGYASEGARALIDRAFRDHGARRVFACTYAENLASRGVMEKCGMRFVRAYRMTAEEVANSMTSVATDAVWPADDVEYALERAEWAKALASDSRRAAHLEPALRSGGADAEDRS
ncbi:MAG TPA: GNAT family N-acetyltransferase, partial [Caulobacteraceae bacterium]|nr:GNAT family N-acetyltransferase [Caulobacteraceae bacterium]